jgi:hypothetical protein
MPPAVNLGMVSMQQSVPKLPPAASSEQRFSLIGNMNIW